MSSSNKVVPALFPELLASTRTHFAFLLLRLVAGPAIALHGLSKIQAPFSWMGPDSGVPGILQALAALSEFGGGIAWTLGLLTPLASLGILSTMAVAASKHISNGDPFVGKGGSYELALLYLVIAAVLLVSGPGRLSVDRLLRTVFSRGVRPESPAPLNPGSAPAQAHG